MGPRIREDTGRGGGGRSLAWGAIDSSLRFAAFRMTCGVRWGNGRFANRPYGGEGMGARRATTRVAPTGEGRVIACARTRGEKMGPRIREDTGRGGIHPHPNLPP